MNLRLMINRLCAGAVTCALPLATWAAWTSSGGETLKDKINPWFFSNTKTVTYCILVDEQNFGQTLQQIRPRVEKALRIWKLQLANLQLRDIGGNLPAQAFALGTQEFVEKSCGHRGNQIDSKGVDLALQFGALSGEQIERIGDPTGYIGLTVRTDYDVANLRARGFMYFSPQNGPLRLNKVGLTNIPWTRNGGRHLLDALLHEFGHVFGLQHLDQFPLMQEDYLEQLLLPDGEKPDSEAPEESPYEQEEGDIFLKFNFFRFQASTDSLSLPLGCQTQYFAAPIESSRSANASVLSNGLGLHQKTTRVWDDFFGISEDLNFRNICFFIESKDGKYQFKAEATDKKGVQTILGRGQSLERLDSSRDTIDAVSVWLPKEQTVFRFSDASKGYYLQRRLDIALMQERSIFKGFYQARGSREKKPFSIQAMPFGQFQVGGVQKGKYYYDLREGF